MATHVHRTVDLPAADNMYKILLIGNSGVGKTQLLNRYVDNTFSPLYISSVGIDFRVKDLVR